eukprot:788865-Pelagomonas_calceolata.AAC.7
MDETCCLLSASFHEAPARGKCCLLGVGAAQTDPQQICHDAGSSQGGGVWGFKEALSQHGKKRPCFSIMGTGLDEGLQPFLGKMFSNMSLAWGLGAVFGPLIGGALAQPCSNVAHMPLCEPGELFFESLRAELCAYAKEFKAEERVHTRGYMSGRWQIWTCWALVLRLDVIG